MYLVELHIYYKYKLASFTGHECVSASNRYTLLHKYLEKRTCVGPIKDHIYKSGIQDRHAHYTVLGQLFLLLLHLFYAPYFLSVYLHPFILPFMHYLPTYLPTYLLSYLYLSIYLSVYLSVCLSICLSIYQLSVCLCNAVLQSYV